MDALAHYSQMAMQALQEELMALRRQRPSWDSLPTIIRDLSDSWSRGQAQLVLSALAAKLDGWEFSPAVLAALDDAHDALDYHAEDYAQDVWDDRKQQEERDREIDQR